MNVFWDRKFTGKNSMLFCPSFIPIFDFKRVFKKIKIHKMTMKKKCQKCYYKYNHIFLRLNPVKNLKMEPVQYHASLIFVKKKQMLIFLHKNSTKKNVEA